MSMDNKLPRWKVAIISEVDQIHRSLYELPQQHGSLWSYMNQVDSFFYLNLIAWVVNSQPIACRHDSQSHSDSIPSWIAWSLMLCKLAWNIGWNMNQHKICYMSFYILSNISRSLKNMRLVKYFVFNDYKKTTYLWLSEYFCEFFNFFKHELLQFCSIM